MSYANKAPAPPCCACSSIDLQYLHAAGRRQGRAIFVITMNVFYSISVLNAKQDEISFLKDIAEDAVIVTAGDWTRVSWVLPTNLTSVTQQAVATLGQAKVSQLKAKLEAAMPKADMVTLHTHVAGVSDFRIVIR